jgi:Leucine-rich repeat (LRR) protein
VEAAVRGKDSTGRAIIIIFYKLPLFHILPASIKKLDKLIELNIKDSKITRLPDEICTIASLKDIYADNNLINYIPENIGKIPAFHRITLENNKLKHVPNSLIPFKLGSDVKICYNDSLVFTPEQKAAWGVTDYQIFFFAYCSMGIPDDPNISKTKPLATRMRITSQNIILLVDRPEKISCRVYDVCGTLVQTLLNQVMTAGTHNILWNRALYSSGVYMLRYTAGASGSFSKVVVVR